MDNQFQQPDNEALANISQLAESQLSLEKEIAIINAQLEEKSEKLARVRDTLLPDAMMNVGMESFTLKDGSKVVVSKFYAASIKPEFQGFVFNWLRENQFGEIIKREIKTKFGKGQDAEATALAGMLTTMKLPFEDKESVHPQTLKAFVREQLEGGKNLPMNEMGVFVGSRAKVTPATK